MPDIITRIAAIIRAKALSKPKYLAMPPTTPSTFLSVDSVSCCGGVFCFSYIFWFVLGDLIIAGADEGTRTRNLLFTKQLLYQLSYVGMVPGERFELPKT